MPKQGHQKMYKISDQNEYADGPISSDMFGINFVLSYDMEFLEAGSHLDALTSLQPNSLRYPGGSITEIMFGDLVYPDQDWADTYFNSLQNGVTQRENIALFVESAGVTNSSIQLVLPTRIAFELSAGQALAGGVYGERREISSNYFNLLKEYIDEFIDQSNQNDVEITKFEIGNEFWGGGQMTAAEYGFLAAKVTEFLDENYKNIDIIAQVSYNAGLFSPVDDSVVYLVKNGNDYDTYFPFEDLSGIANLIAETIPGQGSGVGQTQALAREFAANPEALAALDGIVDHVYFRRGFDGIDGERNHALINIPKTFEDYSGSGPIDYYVTEWSVRHQAGNRDSEHTNHEGLQYASSTLEAFFELTSNGVTGANFWPLTFGNESIDRRVLVDTSESDLTFGGEIFALLSSNLVGLAPAFDFEVPNDIDIHGFSSQENLIFFVSDRRGASRVVDINFSEFGFDDSFFLSITYLSETGNTGTDLSANPIVTGLGGFETINNSIQLDLSAWSIAVVDIQNISDRADHIVGTKSDDVFSGEGGNDLLQGFEGNDTISGNFGNDTLNGGDGDDVLKGGWGSDSILGGAGDDFISGTHGKNYLNGGSGSDTIIGIGAEDYIVSGSENDTIELISGTSFVNSGSGNDVINIHETGDVWALGYYAYNTSLGLENIDNAFVLIEGFERYHYAIDGGRGFDILNLSDRNDAFFLDDEFSGFNSNREIQSTYNGTYNMPRINGIEQIYAGDGNDLVDLVSPVFSLVGQSIDIFGEGGNDTLWGSDADEKIFGGGGDDVLFGGGGENILTGGGGADIFEFNFNSTNTSISDFNGDEGDILRVYTAGSLDHYSMSWNGSELSINTSLGEDEIVLKINIEFEEAFFADYGSDIDFSNFVFFFN